MKLRDPGPSVVLVEREIAGSVLVSQTMPLTVIAAPPSLEIVPPLEAVVLLILEMEFVAIVARVAEVVNDTSSPYAVPAELVAYALT